MSAPYQDDRKLVVDSLIGIEEKRAYRKFKAIRASLKGKFRGQEINNLERILAALCRMAKEGYDVPRDIMIDRARAAALDNTKMAEFLYFVPVKIPYPERMQEARP